MQHNLIGEGPTPVGAGEQELVDRYLNPPDGSAALDAIAALGRARVGLSHLWDASEHRYARFRAAAFDAIANFGPEQGQGSAPFVLKGLEDDNGYVVVAAARAAANLEITTAKPRLRDLTQDGNQYVRSAASLALGRLGDAEDFELLANLVLHDHSFRVIERASRGLGQLGSRHPPTADLAAAADDLLDRASALSPPAQWSATRGILLLLRFVELHRSLRDRLLVMLTADAGVRGDVARTLALHDVQEARPIIEEHLPIEPSPRLRADLIRALQTLGPTPSLEVLVQLGEGPLDTATGLALIDALAEIDDVAAHGALVRLATGADVTLRAATLDRLQSDHPLRLDLALAGLGDTAAPVRLSAAKNLSDRPDLTGELSNALLHETVPEVRLAFQEAIATAGEAPEPAFRYESRQIDAHLLARVPHTPGPVGDAIRLVVMDVITQGGTASEVVAALEALAAACGSTADAYGRGPA